jgi:hypothetical protein
MKPLTKFKKAAQAAAGAGWNQHVDKWTKRYANRVLRRILKEDQKAQEPLE